MLGFQAQVWLGSFCCYFNRFYLPLDLGLCVSRGASFSDAHKGPAWALPVSEWRRGTRQKDTMQPKTSLKFIQKLSLGLCGVRVVRARAGGFCQKGNPALRTWLSTCVWVGGTDPQHLTPLLPSGPAGRLCRYYKIIKAKEILSSSPHTDCCHHHGLRSDTELYVPVTGQKRTHCPSLLNYVRT